MVPRGFDDEELTISMSSTHVRRQQQQQQQQPPPQAQPQQGDAANAPTAMARADQPQDKAKTEQRIGAYTVVRTLGEGSFGKVRLAIHNGTGQKVALKIITRKKLISRDMAGRVEREIEYLQLLRHPHIIKLYAGLPPLSLMPGILILTVRAAIPSSRPRPKSSWCSSTQAASYSTTSYRTAA